MEPADTVHHPLAWGWTYMSVESLPDTDVTSLHDLLLEEQPFHDIKKEKREEILYVDISFFLSSLSKIKESFKRFLDGVRNSCLILNRRWPNCVANIPLFVTELSCT